jgi:hypothetical protein
MHGSPQLCQNYALSAVISCWGIGKRRRGRGKANGRGITVMLLEDRNCQMIDVWVGALSWWRNQVLFFHLSGHLCRMPSLTCFSFHWRFEQGVRIRCGQFLGRCKKRSAWTQNCCELDPLWIWWLPLRWLLLSPTVITVHPCFITGYDIGDKVGVVSSLLFEFPADRNVMGFLVVTFGRHFRSSLLVVTSGRHFWSSLRSLGINFTFYVAFMFVHSLWCCWSHVSCSDNLQSSSVNVVLLSHSLLYLYFRLPTQHLKSHLRLMM